jgi:dipicolinate synthase subunit A
MNVWVIGGDLRQVKLAQLLREDGHGVHTYALERAPELAWAEEAELAGVELADCVVLPLPVAGDGAALNAPLSESAHPLAQVLDALRPGQLICAGRVDPETARLARERGLCLRDYFAREELAVANAVPTVEGALQIAMEELPTTVHSARTLVIGYGRLGRLLAHRFSALGARVSVSARRWEDLAWAEAFGYGVEQTDRLEGWLCGYDLIVNTVPAPVLGRARLGELKEDCLVIDLASKPGGVDLQAAGELGVKVIWALSLPGKVAPVTAARAILRTVYNMISEWRI